MKKIFFLLLGLVLIGGIALFILRGVNKTPWSYDVDTNEFTDISTHFLELNGITKAGGQFIFAAICRYEEETGPKLALLHSNDVNRLSPNARKGFEENGADVIHRVGSDLAETVNWEAAIEPHFRDSSLGPFKLNTIILRGDNNNSVAQDMMIGLSKGEDLLLQYDQDVSRVVPDKFFITSYTAMKNGCKLF